MKKYNVSRIEHISDIKHFATSVPSSELFIAYDWDLTLKIPGRNGIQIRGGAEVLSLLLDFKRRGIEQMIFSATSPSKMNWTTLATEVKVTGLQEVFNISSDMDPQVITLSCGDKIVSAGGLCLSGYNKAEAIEHFMQTNKLSYLIFIDDFVVNTFNVGVGLISKKEPIIKKVMSYWLDPKKLIADGTVKLSDSENSYCSDFDCYRNPVCQGLYFDTTEELNALLNPNPSSRGK